MIDSSKSRNRKTEKIILTHDSTDSVVQRVKRDSEFARSLLDEAILALFEAEPDIARIHLRDLVNGTIGFEKLASQTKTPPKSLHRMLSSKGNPSMDSLAMILGALKQHLNVTIAIRSKAAA